MAICVIAVVGEAPCQCFTFGGHQFAVTYPFGFTNPHGITMTVLATPWNQQTFYDQRLMGTDFANENCLIYLGTGGNCIVYTVTCALDGNQITCPQEVDDDIAICSRFYLPQPFSNLKTDFLKADPNGSNNWCSIWSSFDGSTDPVVSGKGRGFSDIVATMSPSGPGTQCVFDPLQDTTRSLPQQRPPTQPIHFCPAIMPSH